MRILAISHLFPTVDDPRYGIFVARQLAGMARQGAEITVLVPRTWCPPLLRRFERWRDYDHRVSLHRSPGLDATAVPFFRPPGNWFNRWAGLSVLAALRSRARALHDAAPFDIIYASDFFPDGDAAVRLGRVLGIPAACLGIGVDVNDTPHTSPVLYRHFVRTARALDGTLACGQSVADGIRAATGEESLVVFGVLDLEEFTPAPDTGPARTTIGLPAGAPVALFAGYLDRRKGVYELVEAAATLAPQFPDPRVVMCGGGPEEAGLRALIRERGIDANVRLTGEVEPEQMSTWMQASDLFVLPSYTEGVPNVVLEAMACGLPVAATAVGGVPGAVGDCEGVVLVPPADVGELAAAVAGILSDDTRRRRMGAASRTRAEEAFGVERNAGRILDYLERIAAGAGRAAQ